MSLLIRPPRAPIGLSSARRRPVWMAHAALIKTAVDFDPRRVKLRRLNTIVKTEAGEIPRGRATVTS